MNRKVLRIIDANANRLSEALRVCEDTVRFILLDRAKTRRFKSLRHRVSSALKEFSVKKKILVKFRDSDKDIGKRTIKKEADRRTIADIFRANIKRAEESARVLEEFSKLVNPRLSARFKSIRFEAYSLEKSIVKKL